MRDISEFAKSFGEFVKKTNFNDGFPQYEELIKLKHELEKLEKEIKSHTKKLFEFKV